MPHGCFGPDGFNISASIDPLDFTIIRSTTRVAIETGGRSQSARAWAKVIAVHSARRPRCDRGKYPQLHDIGGHACAKPDGADADVAVEDPPALLVDFRIAAAGAPALPAPSPARSWRNREGAEGDGAAVDHNRDQHHHRHEERALGRDFRARQQRIERRRDKRGRGQAGGRCRWRRMLGLDARPRDRGRDETARPLQGLTGDRRRDQGGRRCDRRSDATGLTIGRAGHPRLALPADLRLPISRKAFTCLPPAIAKLSNC
jgi:hypothetical protein